MEISQIINTSIIPVILLPVTGLISLVFYNRLTAVNGRIRLLQKDLRMLHIEEHSPRAHEVAKTLKQEIEKVHFRSKVISFSLVCCLSSLCFFSICALFVAFALFFPASLKIALFFWFIGPILICIGTLAGVIELILGARTIRMQTVLLEKWSAEEEES